MAANDEALEQDARDLFVQAARRSEVGWLVVGSQSQPVWWLWADDALTIVTGDGEQPDPGLVDGGLVTVLARSKDERSRLVSVSCRSVLVTRGSPRWRELAPIVKGKRLNAADHDIDAWSAQIWTLHPEGRAVERPDTMSDDAHRAPPIATPATTLQRRPLMIGRRPRR